MQYLPYVAALALTVGFALLISNVGNGGGPIDRMVAALASLVGGYRGDGWPRGVQEEDRDRSWGSIPPPDEDEPVDVVRLEPAVRVRS